ncbi:hypothetical protein JCM5350_007850 [Sporobolomyces pararoseus]
MSSTSPALDPSSASKIDQNLHLEPLTLDQPGFIYLEKEQKGVQYSFRAAGESPEAQLKAAEYYHSVKEEATVLIAGILRSFELLRTSTRPIRLLSSHGYYLECSFVRAGKPAQAWTWSKDGQGIDIMDVKLRFQFGGFEALPE